jgi:predicted 3-demethylubiquinone-9 3-methyltransferase (glyoxalase superfamily)
MQKITSFLWFNDRAEEAARFYVAVFKRAKIIRRMYYPEGAPAPAGSLATIEFELQGQRFVILNTADIPEPAFKFNESVSFVVNCSTQREIDYYWRKLTSGGGKPSACGWLKDKYGVSWQITPTLLIDLVTGKDRAKAARAFQAMLQMGKIDLKKIKRAAAGR